MPDTLFPVYFNLTYGCLEGQVILLIVTLILTIITLVTQHIPIMTKSHHGGVMSVMMKVGMC